MFFFCLVFAMLLCARLFICTLWSPAVKGLTSWLSFEVSNCELEGFHAILTFLVLQQQQNLRLRFGTSKMHLSRPVAKAAVRFKAVVLLLLNFCLLFLPLRESVIVLCFVARYFMSILVLRSS